MVHSHIIFNYIWILVFHFITLPFIRFENSDLVEISLKSDLFFFVSGIILVTNYKLVNKMNLNNYLKFKIYINR
jgi:hypothetical protein